MRRLWRLLALAAIIGWGIVGGETERLWERWFEGKGDG